MENKISKTTQKKSKHYIALGAALMAGSSLSAQNLIINGDFETGLSIGTGVQYTYTHELGDFITGPVITNSSNWALSTNGSAGTQALFRDLAPAGSPGWAVTVGRYTDSYATNTTVLDLTAGDYWFSADHFSQEAATGSSFRAELLDVNDANTVKEIGVFTDDVAGIMKSHLISFNLDTDGQYQLRLAGNNDAFGSDRAWVDNISLTVVPEPSTYGLLLGLSSIGFAYYLRRKQAKC